MPFRMKYYTPVSTDLLSINDAFYRNQKNAGDFIDVVFAEAENLVRVNSNDPVSSYLQHKLLGGPGLVASNEFFIVTWKRRLDVVNNDGSIVVGADSLALGTINNTQHGQRSAGELHPLATFSTPGFMSAEAKALIEEIPPSFGSMYRTTPLGIDCLLPQPEGYKLTFESVTPGRDMVYDPANGTMTVTREGMYKITFSGEFENAVLSGVATKMYFAFYYSTPPSGTRINIPNCGVFKNITYTSPSREETLTQSIITRLPANASVWVEIACSRAQPLRQNASNLSLVRLAA